MRLTPADLTANLKVAAIPSTRLIQVSFSSNTPAQAASVANAVMSTYASSSNLISIAGPAAVPAAPHPNFVYTIAGGFAGAIIGFVLVGLRHRQQQKRRVAARSTV